MSLSSQAASGSPVVQDLRIVLLGKTGSGKSSAGNTIRGEEVFEAKYSPSSVTKTCKRVPFQHDDRTISIIDTPGIFDTSTTDAELKTEIENCIRLSVPGPHVFLLVIRLDVRFTGEEKTAVEWIKDNFGEEASMYTLVLFTRGDVLGQMSIQTFLNQSPELRELIRACNDKYTVFDNTCMDNRTQVNDLLEKINEIVQLNGTHYTSSLYEEAQRKMESEKRWKKFRHYAPIVGAGLIGAAAAGAAATAAAPAAAALATGEAATAVLTAVGGVIKHAVVTRIPL
ncbi:GTPase IMAP family member 4-like [Xyrichtys novacula]|uniref:GTPase IMAP family member 4-like n=1 Tax=Xyrichtys novacula TaxID=13765 RepID=A0AAV1EWS4_XYRNO|nr:GTPase IMAP family member 4-like [Xyrichtys novacula]